MYLVIKIGTLFHLIAYLKPQYKFKYSQRLISRIYLENNHSYIQWIFPTLKYGQNMNAYPFNTYEIKVKLQLYFIPF